MMKLENKHLVIASGGTGGHFYPTLAVAREFVNRCPGGRVTLLVSGKHSSEQGKIAQGYGFNSCEVPSVRLPNSLGSLVRFPYAMYRCLRAAKKALRALHPDIMLGMGSFAAVPSCWAVNAKKVPLVLHEGNAFMGKANRMFVRKASAIGLALPLSDSSQLRGCRSEDVGMPLRDAIVKAADGTSVLPSGYLESLGLRSGLKTVLVFGGSQGARAVNDAIQGATLLLEPFKDRIQFIHLTGTDDNESLISSYRSAGIHVCVKRSEPNIELCYMACDMVICRSGASSICELSLFGKPLILIPLPTAADDHQSCNAKVLSSAGAAIHLPQSEATSERLRDLLCSWLECDEEWTERGRKLLAFGRPDAASRMVNLLFDVLGRHGQ